MLKWIPIKSSIANNKGIYTFVYRKWLSLKYVLDWAEHLQQGLYSLEGVEYTAPFIAYTRWHIAKWLEYTLHSLPKLLLRLYYKHICRDFISKRRMLSAFSLAIRESQAKWREVCGNRKNLLNYVGNWFGSPMCEVICNMRKSCV